MIQRRRLDREDGGDGTADLTEHAASSGVEQQGLLGIDQEVVEGEAGGADVGDEGGQPEDAIGDLVDLDIHGWSDSLEGKGVGENAGSRGGDPRGCG